MSWLTLRKTLDEAEERLRSAEIRLRIPTVRVSRYAAGSKDVPWPLRVAQEAKARTVMRAHEQAAKELRIAEHMYGALERIRGNRRFSDRSQQAC